MSALTPSSALSPVMQVMPVNIPLLRPQIEPLLAAALVLVSTHTVEDVFRSLLSMRAQLWAQMAGPAVEAVATTEFVDYPAGLFVRVWHAGAVPGHRMDGDAFYRTLDAWRKASGAVGFEAIGRHGWLKRFPQVRVEGLVMRYIP